MQVKIKQGSFSPIFAVLVPSKLGQALFRLVPPARYQKGQIIFYKDHLPYGIYVILSGKVNLEKSGRKKSELAFGSGFALGIALLEKASPYPYTGRIVEDSQISFINRTFLKHLEKKGDPLFKELKVLGEEAAYGQVYNSMQKGVTYDCKRHHDN